MEDAQPTYFGSDLVSEHDKGQEEPSEAEEDIDRQYSSLNYEVKRFISEVRNTATVLNHRKPEGIYMSYDHPHHRQSPHSVPNIEILPLANVEVFHVGLNVETLEVFALFLFRVVASNCCDEC